MQDWFKSVLLQALRRVKHSLVFFSFSSGYQSTSHSGGEKIKSCMNRYRKMEPMSWPVLPRPQTPGQVKSSCFSLWFISPYHELLKTLCNILYIFSWGIDLGFKILDKSSLPKTQITSSNNRSIFIGELNRQQTNVWIKILKILVT